MTPVEERIDQRERALIEKAAAATVGVYPERDHIEAVMDLRELGQVAKCLLTEHSAREEVVKRARFLYEAFQADYHPDKHGMLVRDLGAALAALPATESAQPEEDDEPCDVCGGKGCNYCESPPVEADPKEKP